MKSSKLNKGFVSLLIVLFILFSFSVSALAVIIPGGPSTEGNTNLSSITQYEDMIKELERIEHTSRGRVEVFTLDEYGKSEQGRSIYVAKVGTGPKIIWIQARIHGNEQLVTCATMDLLKTLGSNRAPEIRKILEETTVYAFPILNPDGSEMNIRGTIKYDYPEAGDSTVIDLNRDWTTLEKTEELVMQPWYAGFTATETQAVYKFWCDLKPDYLVDLHHMGIGKVVADTNKYTSFSVGISLAPNGPTLPYTPYNDITRQMAVSVYDALSGLGYANVDTYEMGPVILDYWGGMTSAVMLGFNWDGYNAAGHTNPAIFFETRGNTTDGSFGQRASGYLTRQNYIALRGLLSSIATGNVYEVDPDRWENDIPRYEHLFYMTDYSFNTPMDFVRPCADWDHVVWDCPCTQCH